MKDVIEATKELCRAIQADKRYRVLRESDAARKNDKELQRAIRDRKAGYDDLMNFYDALMDIPDGDVEAPASIAEKINKAADTINNNENYQAYKNAKAGVSDLFATVVRMLTLCVKDGYDPETAAMHAQLDVAEESDLLFTPVKGAAE